MPTAEAVNQNDRRPDQEWINERVKYDREILDLVGDHYGDLPLRISERIRAIEKGKREMEDDEDELLYETELEHNLVKQRNWITTRLKQYADDPAIHGHDEFRANFRIAFRRAKKREEMNKESEKQLADAQHEMSQSEKQVAPKPRHIQWTQPYVIGDLRVPVYVLNQLEKDGIELVVLRLAQTLGAGHIRKWLQVHPKQDLYQFFREFALSLDKGIPFDQIRTDESDDESAKTILWKDPFEVNEKGNEYGQVDTRNVSHEHNARGTQFPGIGDTWEIRVQWQRWFNSDLDKGIPSRYVDQGVQWTTSGYMETSRFG